MTSLERIAGLMPQIYDDLEKVSGDYCIIGSAALVLAGIQIPVNDLDLLTTQSAAVILKKAWAKKKVNDYHPEKPDRFRSEFGRFGFSLPVEVMGDLEVFRSGKWDRVIAEKTMRIDVAGFMLKIPTLDEQRRILYQLGRPKDLEKIKLIESV